MKLYGLHEGFYEGIQLRIKLLGNACAKKEVDFICIDSLNFDYTQIPNLTKQDMLYNFARGSKTLENLLLNENVTTFYRKNPQLNTIRSTTDWAIIHDKLGIQAPKTVFHFTTDRELLKKYVEHLGGFPIIIKVTGGTRGIGTIKIESWQNLVSTMDYLLTTNNRFIMREFINAKYGARIMVLGEEVILSSKFFFQENDFRNAPILSSTNYESMEIDTQTKKMCIEAVKSVNLELGGVDILFDKEQKPYLLEINFPTGFQSFKDNPDYILSQMLTHLIKKANTIDNKINN
jgi:hypothetical protein